LRKKRDEKVIKGAGSSANVALLGFLKNEGVFGLSMVL